MVKRNRDASASNTLAAEDAKCCRLSPHPTAANDLAEGEPGVLANDHGEWVQPKLLLPSTFDFGGHCALPTGPQTFSDSCADALDNATHELLTMKRYMDMSDAELKELQFLLLVDLQKLVCYKLQILAYFICQLATHHYVVQGTNVAVLVGEALLATDKRHCAALSALLKGRQYQAMASFFRYGWFPSLLTYCKGLCLAHNEYVLMQWRNWTSPIIAFLSLQATLLMQDHLQGSRPSGSVALFCIA